MANGTKDAPATKRQRSNRWSDLPSTSNQKTETKSVPSNSKALAQSIAQRLAALKQKKLAASRTTATLPAVAINDIKSNHKKRSSPSTVSPTNVLDSNSASTNLNNTTMASTSTLLQPTSSATSLSSSSLAPSKKRAKVYDFDMNVIERPTSVYQKQAPVVKKNPYLAHRETAASTTTETTGNSSSYNPLVSSTTIKDDKFKNDDNSDGNNDIILDGRLAGGQIEKMRKRHKALTFVQPGTFIELAKRKREKAMNAVQSGFTSGRKVGLHHKSVGIASEIDTSFGMSISNEGKSSGDDFGQGHYYGHGTNTVEKIKEEEEFLPPRADSLAADDSGNNTSSDIVLNIAMPLIMEWWDIELLPSKLKKEVIAKEGKDIAKRTRKRMDMTQPQVTLKKNVNEKDEDKAKQEQEEHEYKQILELQSKCFILASISNAKTSILVQHPQPILPIGRNFSDLESANQNSQGTLHLTKKEMKRQRKLRRAEKQREQQDLQAAGLLPPPEPKLTLSNFMRVMGNQAVMDPSQMEKVVLEQIQSRKLKHEKMNEDRKLSKEARSLKRKNKLLKENVDMSSSTCVSVALFLVKDMGHPYHRAKVDLNAQQMEITGGVLECFDDENPKEGLNLSLVIAEGGSKVIKKYIRLMMVRMKWKGEQSKEESEDDQDEEGGDEIVENMTEKGATKKFNPNNYCDLVWTGLAPKRMFNSFMFQACSSERAARKILEAKGVAHFWDQVKAHSNRKSDSFHLKLGDSLQNDRLEMETVQDGDVVIKEEF